MRFRQTISTSLRRTVGPERTEQLRRIEARARSRVIDALDIEGNRPVRRKRPPAAVAADRPVASLSREELIAAHGRQSPEGLSHPDAGALPFVSPDPSAPFPRPTMSRHAVLAQLHERLRPRTYFEIGISTGASLQLSRTKTVAVDPAFAITEPIACDVRIVRETSDDFFAAPGALDHFAGVPIDLAFIDGMHLAEFALRDFMNTERHMSRAGVIVLDDMLPRNSLEAFRIRRTGPWTGDVYKVHQILTTYRPDLTIIPVNSYITGSYLVVGLDPESTVLRDHYAEIEELLVSPDPQVVPQEWLERRSAVDPQQLLELDAWQRLVDVRESSASGADLEAIWAQLRALRPVAAV